MAAALPVVTPVRETAIAEVVGPDEICAIDRADDPVAYAEALERLASDPSAARTRAARLSARAPEFGIERYAREMLALLLPR
jgi:glycosyltransferase involved in cell wall biosynthesis